MAKERENFSNTELDTAENSDMPVFSFNASGTSNSLKSEDFDISGNTFSAFYDNSHKLIFVLDKTKTENTPNTLLIIANRAGRKWDDILANDYNVDLENIRPKENNKYQKLDIDYNGLSIYGQLIADYETNADLTDSLNKLNEFRKNVGQQAARSRLVAAKNEIKITTETIRVTNKSITKLRAQIKLLKAKLSKARSEVGKKPTKESAARILKIQSQIDKATDKEKRARIRLRRAKKRLEDAQNNVKLANQVLNIDTQINEIKPKEPEMAEEQPKPLFNQDPEIMDDKIAFKPVGFEAPSFVPMDEPVSETQKNDNAVPTTPSEMDTPAEPTPESIPTPVETPEPVMPEQQPEPVPVAEPEPIPTPMVTPEPIPAPVETPEPVTPEPTPIVKESEITVTTPTETPEKLPAPEKPMATQTGDINRPASPTTGKNVTVLNPGAGSKKPTMIYYIMLMVLIALSVLTLWMYQSKMDNSATPNLASPAVTEPAREITPQPATESMPQDSAFIETEPVAVQQPEPKPIPTPAPIVPEMEQPAPAPQPIMPQPVAQPEPIMAEPIPAPVQPIKPIVQQQEQPMPVPAPVPAVRPQPALIVPQTTTKSAPLPEPSMVRMEKPKVIIKNIPETDVNKPEYPVYGPNKNAASAMPETNQPTSQVCTSGTAPDENGCCTGESLKWVESFNGYACCSLADGECYPPLK